MERTLWIIGMMGSGKSTVAPLVAAALGAEWVDTDDLVEQSAGRTVPELFDESEWTFRQHESATVRELAGRSVVVACGGGVVTRPENVDVMRRSGAVVWLRAEPATLVRRVGPGAGRPLLSGDPVAAVERIDRERAALYRAAADAVVDTDDRDVGKVASEVVRAWNASSAG